MFGIANRRSPPGPSRSAARPSIGKACGYPGSRSSTAGAPLTADPLITALCRARAVGPRSGYGVDRQTSTGWRARWRTPEGASRSKNFPRKADAERFLTRIEASKLDANYIDPAAGRVTFGAFATAWLAAQTFDASTREAVASRLRVHLLPAFGNVEIRHIRPSMVQAWLRDRQERTAPRSVRVLLANLSGILGAAVEDGLIARNPCASKAVRAPAVEQDRIIPWTLDRVVGVVAAHPARWRALPLVAAGCGLRQGEVFGLRVEDVDFLRHRVHVRQQVKLLAGRPMIAPPKGRKTREVPLPEMVAAVLAEHLRATPAIDGLVSRAGSASS